MEGMKRRRLNGQAWRELFRRHEDSGESIGAFCRREGVSTHSYRRWKLRLGEPGATSASKLAVAAKPSKANKPAPAGSFVDLGALATAAPAAGRFELRLDLGGGVTLHVVRG